MDKKEQETLKAEGAAESHAVPTFEEPKLEFIEPKLTDHGDLAKVTHSFFGTFTP